MKENFCLVILLSLWRRRPASPARDHPAGPAVAPSPSPAAHHSRSQITQRG